MLLRQISPERRSARRRSYLYLLTIERRRRSYEQLGRAVQDAAETERIVRRLNAWAHHVRPALQHGTNPFAYVADRRATDGLALRGREHAHHGAHRHAGLCGD